jgi:hypothetical protein
MSLPAILLSLILFAPVSTEVSIVQFPLRSKISLSLGGKNKAEVERAGTVSRVSIQMDALQPPQSVVPRMNTYVVWTVSPEGSFENLGELEISGTKGALIATTRFDRFGIFITPEPHYMVDKPHSRIVFKNETPRAVPAVPLTVEVGAYEYTNLPENTTAAPALVMEARAALAIASSVMADRRAVSEFRRAKASLDTMEELVTRASPPDVIAAAANAAIRSAERATSAARQTVR